MYDPSTWSIAVGAGIGGAIFLLILVVAIRSYFKTRQYRHAVKEIEAGLHPPLDRPYSGREVPRRPSVAHRPSAHTPYAADGGWKILSSAENVHRQLQLVTETKQESDTKGSGYISSRSGLNRVLRFGRSNYKQPSIVVKENSSRAAPVEIPEPSPLRSLSSRAIRMRAEPTNVNHVLQNHSGDIDLAILEKPQPARLASVPQVSHLGHWAPLVATGEKKAKLQQPRTVRSTSMGSYLVPNSHGPVSSERMDPQRRARSVSLSASSIGPAPTCPLPPLPTFAVPNSDGTAMTRNDIANRPGASADPRSNRRVSSLQPRNTQARAGSTNEDTRHSVASMASIRSSVSSMHSYKRNSQHLAVPQIKVADTLRISRVSSCNSLDSENSVRLLFTPRRGRNSRVSLTGSPLPLERVKTARQEGCDPLLGSDFRPRSSAMKGGRSAKKGHKRHTMVRISTLAPVEFGPETISEDEHSSSESLVDLETTWRDPSKAYPEFASSTTASNVRIAAIASNVGSKPTSLRASLTPSSPALSLAAFYQSRGQDFQPASPGKAHPDLGLSRDASLITIPDLPTAMDFNAIMALSPRWLQPPGPATDVGLSSDVCSFASTDSPTYRSRVGLGPRTLDTIEQEDSQSSLSQRIPFDHSPSNPKGLSPATTSSSPCFPFAKSDSPSGQPTRATSTATSRSADKTRQPDHDSPPPGLLIVKAEKPLDLNKPLPTSDMPSSSKRASNRQTLQSPLTSNPLANIPILAPMSYDQDDVPIPWPLRPSRQSTAITTAPLQGPRTQPAATLRKSIAMLRRMDSEMEDTQSPGVKRYLKLGREASPLLPFTGFEDLASEQGADAGALSGEGMEYDGESAGARDDGFDFVFNDTGTGALNATTGRESKSSVWDDGENFWCQEKQLPNDIKNGVEKKRMRFHDVTWDKGEKSGNALLATPDSKLNVSVPRATSVLRGEALKQSPARSILETPKSLYDAVGFLKD